MIKNALLLLFCLFVFDVCLAQTGTEKDVDDYLKRYINKVPVPGLSIVIVEGDKVRFSKGYGVERMGQKKPMSPQSVLAIGSLGRGFTSLAIMQLVEEGLLNLDEPIVSYLPWFETANKEFSDQITLRMCLSNITGIPPQFESLPDLENSFSSEEFLRSLKASFIKRKPGMSHEFSDEGYSIAGEIIRVISGMSYAEYIDTKVLQPLDMLRSTTDKRVAKNLDIVYGHEMGISQNYPADSGITDANFIAAGSEFYSTAEDLGHYMIALLNQGSYKGKKLVSPSSIEEIFKPNTSFQGLGTMLGGNGIDIQYALGWMGMIIEERDILIHTGSNGNVASIMGINLAQNQAFVILFNTDVNQLDRFEYPGMEHAVNNVIHILNAEDTTDFGIMRRGIPTEEDYILDKKLWHKYIGKYNSFGRPSPFFKDRSLEVFVGDSGELELISKREEEFKGQYRLQFTNESRAILQNLSFERQIQFSINPEGEVSGLFMFGSEFKKENESILNRFVQISDPKNEVSFLLPTSTKATWSGNDLTAIFDDGSAVSMFLSTSKIKSVGFKDFISNYLDGMSISQKGILNKEVLKRGIWSEQTIVVTKDNQPIQYLFAAYQDPVSSKQMQLVLKSPWGSEISRVQEVIANIHRSVRFE